MNVEQILKGAFFLWVSFWVVFDPIAYVDGLRQGKAVSVFQKLISAVPNLERGIAVFGLMSWLNVFLVQPAGLILATFQGRVDVWLLGLAWLATILQIRQKVASILRVLRKAPVWLKRPDERSLLGGLTYWIEARASQGVLVVFFLFWFLFQ